MKKRPASVAVYLVSRLALLLVAFVGAGSLCPTPAFGQTNTTWKGGSGNWSNPANWTSGVPNGNFNAFIDGGNPAISPVTLDINASIVNLTVDSDDGLTLNNGTTFTVTGGSITNNGVMKLNGGGGANGLLDLNSNVTLKGGGTFTLSAATGAGSAFIQQGVGGVTLTNQSTIQGTGIIGNGGLTLANQGTIDANSAAGQAAIVLNGSGGVTNTGLLEATNGGTLSIQNSVINTGGKITASGTSSTVVLNGASITGGTLNGIGGGTMETGGSGATLNGVTISTGSTYTASNNTTTHLNGTITNNGTILLNGGSGANGLINLDSNVTLTGGGTVKLSAATGPGSAYIEQGVGGVTLTNTNDLIQGTGIIGNGGLTLKNQATINANTSSGQAAIVLNGSGGVTNTGLLEATNGGTLSIQNSVTNAGGSITASGTSSTVVVNGASIMGGTLNSTGGGTMETGGSGATLDGSTAAGAVTLSSGSTYTASNNATTLLVGTITNKGTIRLNGGGGANGIMNLGSAAAPNFTLQGGGTIVLSTTTVPSNSGAAYVQQAVGGVTLTNVDNTIVGEGVIGNGGLTLVNQSKGIIDANSTGAPLITTLTLNGSGGVANAGLLEATNSGILQITNAVNNTGGKITASGASSTVVLNGASITGGTLNGIGGGTMETGGSGATLNGVTISTGSTYTASNNTTTHLNGTITNNGTILLNGGSGANGLINLDSNVTLTGGGTVKLSAATGAGSAYIEQGVGGVTLTNTNDIIQGTGIIGNGGLTLKNQATINANTSSGQAAIVLNGSGGVTNTGLLEATNGGTLSIQNSVINTGGKITASGTSSTVVVNGASITGGTLNGIGGGTMETGGSGATLNGVTISTGSTYTASNNTTTHLNGTITNNGTILLNGGSGANGLINLDSSVTLTGGGTVTLSAATGAGSAYIEQGVGGVTLTNTNDIIQGTGIIGNGGLTLVNQPGGTLFANVSGQTLLINGSGNITNTGTMKVASGSAMHVTNGHLTNFAGTTLTGGTYNVSGTLEIDQLGNTGGEVFTNAANIILNTSASRFIDAAGLDAVSRLNTNATTGAFSILGGRNFTTVGNFTNNGSLTVGGGSTFAVKAGSSLINFSSATHTLTGGIFTVGGTLKWSGANIVTNASNLTLTGGSGQILNATSNANALANFAANNSSGSFTLAVNQNFTTGGNFTNNGKLTVNSGSTFALKNGSSLTNFNGSTHTLTGGAYTVGGALEFTGANIVINAANITLTGSASKIINQFGANGLANFASNTSGGSFNLLSGRSFSTVGNFSNAGTLSIASGSGFTVGGTGVFTETAGTTTDDGAITDSGGFNLTGGKLFGKGAIAGAVHNSTGTITPGDSSIVTGVLTDKGAYTQGANGILDVSIGGTTAGTQFDQLNPTTAALNGTLNVSLIKGFVPTIGQTFKIMNFTSETGTFAHCTCAINTSEHFAITYQGTDVLLTVVAGGGGNFTAPSILRQPAALSSSNLNGNGNPRAISTVSDYRSFSRADLRLLSGSSDFRALSGSAWMRANLSTVQFPAFSARPDAGGILRDFVGLREGARGVRTQTTFGNSKGAPRLRSNASGLRSRSVVGGLSWGWSLSNPLSNPKPGFAIY